MAQLEDQLGVRLLERTTRALRLTEAGRTYQAEVTPALETVEEGRPRLVADRDTRAREAACA